jgi:two-component system alkaline phosphatase synthesis response regulator PhoP
MSKKTVCLIEDDMHIQQLVKYNLENQDYIVNVLDSGNSILNETWSFVPDIFILDIMLPGISGYEICKILKSTPETCDIPIIFLTAKSEEYQKILGLEIGADDYLTKPFSVKELCARVKVLLRRTQSTSSSCSNLIIHSNIIIDVARHKIKKSDKEIELSLKEFELIKILMTNKGKVLTREFLLEKIWGYDYLGETRTVDVHVRYLRKKIEDDDSKPVYIETVRGIGYRFNDN